MAIKITRRRPPSQQILPSVVVADAEEVIPNDVQQSVDICKDVMKAWIVSLAKKQARADYESSHSPAST